MALVCNFGANGKGRIGFYCYIRSMIGVFDSGCGGLSVLKEIIKLLPDEKYIYLADNAHCPYGEKTKEYITDRCREITRLLMSKGAEIIVVACNTATAAAISSLRSEFPIKFIGMEPAVKPAALGTKSGVIGVLATAGTLKGSKYLATKSNYEDGCKIVEHVGEGFVEIVENGTANTPQAAQTVRSSLYPLLDQGADTIVLGCTHYPFLLPQLQEQAAAYYGGKVLCRFIDPAPAVANHLVDVMREEGLLKDSPQEGGGSVELIATGSPERLVQLYSKIS